MDTRSIIAPLSSATKNLAAIARNIGERGSQLRNSFHEEEVRKQLMLAAETLRDAAQDATRVVRSAAAPYAQSAQEIAASTQEQIASGARAMARRMRDKPNLVTRHPYATVIVVAGAAWFAVREWRKRRNSPAVKKVTAAARKAVNGAKKPAPRRRAAPAAAKSASAVH
ncbi:MAG TPA: hypothetical protein VN720_05645 [Rudaea sp.]|nr:hypothetical protein [Rudaea sp.]